MGGAMRELQAAIIADMQDIAAVNGFNHTLALLETQGMLNFTSAASPAVEVLLGGSGPVLESDPEAHTQYTGDARHLAALRLAVKSGNAQLDMADLIDDVSNAVERLTSHVNQTSVKIVSVTVTAARPEGQTGEDVANGWLVFVGTVDIHYSYRRGER